MKRQQFMLTFQFPLFCIVGVQPQCKLGVFSYGSYHSDIKREEPKQNQRQITNKHATIRKYHTLNIHLSIFAHSYYMVLESKTIISQF